MPITRSQASQRRSERIMRRRTGVHNPHKRIYTKIGWTTNKRQRRKQNKHALTRHYDFRELNWKAFPVTNASIETALLNDTLQKQQILYAFYHEFAKRRLTEYRNMTFDELNTMVCENYDVQHRDNDDTRGYVYLQEFEFKMSEEDQYLFPQ